MMVDVPAAPRNVIVVRDGGFHMRRRCRRLGEKGSSCSSKVSSEEMLGVGEREWRERE